MTEVIRWGTTLYDIPAGFRKVTWDQLTIGQEVFIAGKKGGKSWAYGPHKVYDPTQKLLERTVYGVFMPRIFVENTDGVLVRI